MEPEPFVAAGYAVLLPDPAISTGYGQSMIDRGQHELGGAPFTDIMALTDATVARADIDAERTAFAGGSYGGYMANWVAGGHTGDRFRCIVTHASLWDTDSMGRTTDNSGWERPMREQNRRFNPRDFVGDIVVPMLVIHGDKDYRVPISQGHALWYDLHEFSATPPRDAEGRTQHRYLYFPPDEATGSSAAATPRSGMRPSSASSTSTSAARTGQHPQPSADQRLRAGSGLTGSGRADRAGGVVSAIGS